MSAEALPGAPFDADEAPCQNGIPGNRTQKGRSLGSFVTTIPLTAGNISNTASRNQFLLDSLMDLKGARILMS